MRLKSGHLAPHSCAARPCVRRPIRWTPKSYAKRFAELEQKQMKLVQRKNHSCTDSGLADYVRQMLPRTYLQMVAQKLLYHAVRQLPQMLQLPQRMPSYVMASLYTRPFGEAVKLALQHIFEQPSVDPTAFVPDMRQAGTARQYRSLVAIGSDSAGGGDMANNWSQAATQNPAGPSSGAGPRLSFNLIQVGAGGTGPVLRFSGTGPVLK